jgi:hypothetical protein
MTDQNQLLLELVAALKKSIETTYSDTLFVEWSALVRRAERALSQPAAASQADGAEVESLIERLTKAAGDCAVMHANHQGKAMHDDVWMAFSKLRDETIPSLKKQVAAMCTTPVPEAGAGDVRRLQRADIIRLASQAAAQHGHTIKPTDEIVETLEAFAGLVLAINVPEAGFGNMREAEQGKPLIYVASGHLREVVNGNAMLIYASPEADRFADVALFTHTAPDHTEQSRQMAGDNPSIPLSAIRPIVVEAIRELMGCPDIVHNGKTLTDTMEEIALAFTKMVASRQHARDSAELRRLCQSRDDEKAARKAAEQHSALKDVEIAGLNSSVEHLSALVDDARSLLQRAMQVMKELHESAQPDESQDGVPAVIPGAAFAQFVDAHAELMYAIANSPHAHP